VSTVTLVELHVCGECGARSYESGPCQLCGAEPVDWRDGLTGGKQLVAPDPLRQSYIQRFDACALSLLLDLLSPNRSPSDLAARGTLFHRWVAKALTLMRDRGETTMPVDLGLSMLLDVCAQKDIPDDEVVHLPMREMAWLRIAVTRWCEMGEFNAQRIVALEEPLEGTILVPDGQGGFYERQLIGHPDVLVADPPGGIICVDWKSGWAPPSKEREHQPGEVREDKISDQGFVQQVVYGLLILQNFPVVQRVTLREFYLLFGEYREATIDRANLERTMDVVAATVAQIDDALAGGIASDRWIPRAGTHCGICPAVRKCPISDWEGIPETYEEARLLANEWIVSAEVRKDRLPLLKGWVDANGPLELDHAKGRRVVGWPDWDGESRTRGTFKVYEPLDAPESPFDRRLMEIHNRRFD
jgi:hypothetical protein